MSKLLKLANELSEELARVQELNLIMKVQGVETALSTWYMTREEYEALDDIRKEIGKTLETMSRDTLPDLMRDADVKTITIASLSRRFTRSQRVSCSILDKPAGYEWLRSTGNGDLIQPTVNAQTLSSFAKKHIEDGGELPEDLFKVSTSSTISATKV